MYSLWVSANDLVWLSLSVQKYVINFTHTLRFNPYAAGTVYIRFQANFKPINLTGIAKIFRGRCLVNLIITFWRCIFFQKYKKKSSFGAGNCVSNSSFKWMKNNLEKNPAAQELSEREEKRQANNIRAAWPGICGLTEKTQGILSVWFTFYLYAKYRSWEYYSKTTQSYGYNKLLARLKGTEETRIN